MSASKEEAISTVEAAMATYSVSGKGKSEFNQLLKSFEEKSRQIECQRGRSVINSKES